MACKKPLFVGSNTLDQLDKILDTIGSPKLETITKIPNKKAREYLAKQPRRPVPVEILRPKDGDIEPEIQAIMGKMLNWDPDSRATAENLLADPYLADLHDTDDEPACNPVPQELFEYERRNVTAKSLEEEIYGELLEYHPAAKAEYLATNPTHDMTAFPLLPTPNTVDEDDLEADLPQAEESENPILQTNVTNKFLS
jgi:serine/threonine protein kinase